METLTLCRMLHSGKVSELAVNCLYNLSTDKNSHRRKNEILDIFAIFETAINKNFIALHIHTWFYVHFFTWKFDAIFLFWQLEKKYCVSVKRKNRNQNQKNNKNEKIYFLIRRIKIFLWKKKMQKKIYSNQIE